MYKKKKDCQNTIDSNAMKKEIKRLSHVDKLLIPKYLDNIKKTQKTIEKEITKDNPYYGFL